MTEDPSGATEEKSAAAPKKAKKESTATPVDEATAGTTNLGALLKAKLDNKN